MKRSVWVAGIFLLAGCAVRFVPGMKFSAYLCAGVAALFFLYALLDRWAKKSRRGSICKAIFLACVLAGTAGFLSLEALLISHGAAENTALSADAVIVLGAGVNGKTPSLILQSRIDAAADYLRLHPETQAILSGGQGPGEEITEAQAMYDALVKAGIGPERLLLEETSTSTAENFRNSRALLKARGMDVETCRFAVVTNGFHAFRAHWIAERAGLQAFDVPAKVPWPWLDANYYAREAFALVKTVLLDGFGGAQPTD